MTAGSLLILTFILFCNPLCEQSYRLASNLCNPHCEQSYRLASNLCNPHCEQFYRLAFNLCTLLLLILSSSCSASFLPLQSSTLTRQDNAPDYGQVKGTEQLLLRTNKRKLNHNQPADNAGRSSNLLCCGFRHMQQMACLCVIVLSEMG